ncbi:lipase [Floricoccus penangensis]|uniref:Lipase n=1 Tax=Floricoccus penangensis TaxID=1859475 RepID=A0A9Q5NYU4_9LACT|nr:alpha/beta hydrolase [Floricoccus penangensis]OFI45949.1 lipase [Floricoccus penangensis]
MKKKIAIIVSVAVAALLLIFFISVVVTMRVSPKPTAVVLNKAVFKEKGSITDKDSHEKTKDLVVAKYNLEYKSSHKNNTFDVYYPKEIKDKVPVLFWVHGGGYLGGDKEMVKEFASKLVAHNQVAVVSMNYELAPDSQYPNQLIQLDEFYKYMVKNQDQYQHFDFSKLFFGGDSAGAQIALQYGLVETNKEYADSMKFEQSIPKGYIKGMISYCGPVNLVNLIGLYGENQAATYTISSIAWSIIGTREWKTSSQIKEASIAEHVTADYPPTYITDGNFYSFEDQGKTLEEKLKNLKVPVKTLFFDDTNEMIFHEYQFNYTKPAAKKCFDETEEFIRGFSSE